MDFKINYISFLFLLSIITLSHTQTDTDKHPIFISLGKDCESAYHLRSFNLRQEAYPFDWLVTTNFNTICTLLTNEFTDFLNPLYFKYDDNAVIHTKYNIIFHHDFPTDPLSPYYVIIPEPQDTDHLWYSGNVNTNYLDHLDGIIKKYTRRIKRLLSILKSNSTILFFRTQGTPEEAKQFVHFMKTHFPLVDYQLFVTYNDPSLNYDWNIPHVIKHHRQIPQQTPGFNLEWMHENEWEQIFSNLGFK